MYHNFLIQLSVDGHVGHFHILVTVNSVVRNIQANVFVSFSMKFLSGYMPRSGMLYVW